MELPQSVFAPGSELMLFEGRFFCVKFLVGIETAGRVLLRAVLQRAAAA